MARLVTVKLFQWNSDCAIGFEHTRLTMQPSMFSSKLPVISTTTNLFHLERFTIYNILNIPLPSYTYIQHHTHRQTDIHRCTHKHIHSCMHEHRHTCMHTHRHMHAHINTHLCRHIRYWCFDVTIIIKQNITNFIIILCTCIKQFAMHKSIHICLNLT